LSCLHREFSYESVGENRSTSAKVIIKHQGVYMYFFETQCIGNLTSENYKLAHTHITCKLWP